MKLLRERPLLILLALGLILVSGFFLLNHFIYTEKQGDEVVTRPYRGTLQGEYVCLPYKEGMELVGGRCAFGIKTDAGEYYAIDFAQMSAAQPQLTIGERIEAEGIITPLAALDARQWSEYPIEGSFSVTDSLEVLPK